MTKIVLPTKKSSKKPSEEHWVPLSDLMTGLMMIFMLIAVVFMIQVQAEAQKTKLVMEQAAKQALVMQNIAKQYKDLREKLYFDLYAAFKNDLPKWGAELNKDLSIRFKEPEVLFESQKADLKPRFTQILADFFPRYVGILNSKQYRESIEEIRIEGHTSSNWIGSENQSQAYMLNMELSQARTRSVLQYVLSLKPVATIDDWLRRRLTANGLSSSKPIYQADGKTENIDASRRVEFRVRTNADERFAEVMKAAKQ